jgi:hypothetical protein
MEDRLRANLLKFIERRMGYYDTDLKENKEEDVLPPNSEIFVKQQEERLAVANTKTLKALKALMKLIKAGMLYEYDKESMANGDMEKGWNMSGFYLGKNGDIVIYHER